LADLDEVNSVYELFGEWDIIAKVGVDSIAALDGFISDTVRNIKGVTITSTIVISR
jgi:DNA-binding Lrp family transcriptional regulator